MPVRVRASCTGSTWKLICRSCGTNTPTCKGRRGAKSEPFLDPGREKKHLEETSLPVRAELSVDLSLPLNSRMQLSSVLRCSGEINTAPSRTGPWHNRLGPASVAHGCWLITVCAGTDPFRVGYRPRTMPARFSRLSCGWGVVAPACRTTSRAPAAPSS